MILGKLKGYDIATGQYIDGQGEIVNLPKSPFCVVTSNLSSDYDDISSVPEYWDKYGFQYLGSVTGFKDWMSLRAIIRPLITAICGVDYSNWDALNSDQKEIILRYAPTKIIDAQGFTFLVTKSGGLQNAYSYLDHYLSKSQEGRSARYDAYMKFGYNYLGTAQGLKAESLLRSLFLDVTYIKRGVLYIADDGIEGLGNWTISDNGFLNNGLKARIQNGEFVLGGGIDVNTFINTLQGILDNGTY